MQFFERGTEPPPTYLSETVAREARSRLLRFFRLDPVERAQKRLLNHAIELRVGDIYDGLQRLFHGKCAFCESLDSTLPYRFRPPSSATPEDGDGYLYYTWLANAWENIYPICPRCVPREPEFFPVRGRRASLPTIELLRIYVFENLGLWRAYPLDESPVLLDPCRTLRFHEQLFISISGTLTGLTPRGTLTINHFELNREELISARRKTLGQYRSELLKEGVAVLRAPGAITHRLFDFAGLEFGGLWYLQCRQIVEHLSTILGRPSSVSRSKIGNSFKMLFRQEGFDKYRRKLIRWIERENFGLHSTDPRALSGTSKLRASDVSGRSYKAQSHPTLLSIELTNFKAIDYLKLQLTHQTPESVLSGEPVQPAMLILGENSTGKSSILEATALALCDGEARRSLEFEFADLILDPTRLGAQNQPRMASTRIRLDFDSGPAALLKIQKTRVSSEIATVHPLVFAYGAFRQYQKSSDPYVPGSSIFNLFNSERLLPNPEPWLLGLDDSVDFPVVARALGFFMAVDGDVDGIVKSDDRQSCLIITRHGKYSTLTPLSEASSGYRSVLAMVCDIMRRLMDRETNPHYQSMENARAVVLIDEVEAHLHPRWKIQIMSALRKALPKVTFIATSHDPLCIRGMHNGEVVVVHRTARMLENSHQHPIQIDQLTDLPDVTQLTVEQLLTSDFFSLASTDQPLMNLKMATVADLLSKSNGTGEGKLDIEEQQVVALFKQQINEVLPVGTTEGQRLVQIVVAEFLQDRATANSEKLKALNVKTKARIRAILEGF